MRDIFGSQVSAVGYQVQVFRFRYRCRKNTEPKLGVREVG